MFKAFKRRAVASFDICPRSPLTIGSGSSNELDPSLPDITFVSGFDGAQRAFVIPGSSLKGVLRSYIEKNYSVSAASALFGALKTAKDGSTKSKIAVYDAFADMSKTQYSVRYQIKIDPHNQCTNKSSLRNIQTVNQGVFKASFAITNFSDDELKYVYDALNRLNDGLLRLGAKTSVGFGKVSIENFKLRIYLTPDPVTLSPRYRDFEGLDFNALDLQERSS